ncbi:MAG: MBL fold metallo-hydrolase [Chloroflexota bacterium]|nr:MBL fold metallo-hydrolase [Chloroflexota bacterium]
MSNLEIVTYPAGPIETNGYLVIDQEAKSAIVIDAPSGFSDAVVADIRDRGLTVTGIVITHGHWDHIGDTALLKRELGVPVLAHRNVVDRLKNPGTGFPVQIEASEPDRLIDEGDSVTIGSHSFEVWFLPGHDPGHIVLVSTADRIVLGGDVLFPGGHGTIEIPGADPAAMMASLKRLAALPDDVTVYPGHGVPTQIGKERGWLPSRS